MEYAIQIDLGLEKREVSKNERLIKRGPFLARIAMGLTQCGREIDLLPSLRERVSPIASQI